MKLVGRKKITRRADGTLNGVVLRFDISDFGCVESLNCLLHEAVACFDILFFACLGEKDLNRSVVDVTFVNTSLRRVMNRFIHFHCRNVMHYRIILICFSVGVQ